MTFPLFATVVGGLLMRRHLAFRRRDPARFLATVSHELRTPLHAIMGWVNLLKSGTLATQETTHALECIERNVRLEAQLVDQLLDASRLLSGRATLVLAPVDLAATVDGAIACLLPAARAKGVAVQSTTDGPAIVAADARRLSDVISQLLANAIKFTSAGGSITVNVETTTKWASVRIADTGEGIAAEDLPYVFEPFQQGRTESKRTGLGLGLAVVRHVVELHRGSVSAHSAGPGQGAVFRLTLPRLSSRSGLIKTRER